MRIEDEEKITTFEDDTAAKQRLFEVVTKWFLKTGLTSGESLAQSDTTYEEAPLILEKALEALKWKEKWKE